MEQQKEEKKIRVHKRQRKQSNSSSSLPLDLISEILLRLPEKSVVRSRCVSKAWSSITTDPYFINMFKTRSPRLLLCVKANEKLFVSSIPQHIETSNKSYSSSELIDPYHMEFPTDSYFIAFTPTESVQGLICFQEFETPIVWNPSTRQLLTLPKPGKSWDDYTIFLGYDPVESKHKIMCLPCSRNSDECRVLTLGSPQESWRTVKTNLSTDLVYLSTSGRCIKGVVYYLLYVYPTYVIMSFDVRSEKFDKIQLPPSDFYQDMLLVYQGRLACIGYKPNKKKIKSMRLWILEDAEKHKWSSKKFLVPSYYLDKRLRNYLVLKGFTRTGEFIYVPHMFDKSSYILLYDPVRNSCRRFELKGITGDESVPNNICSRITLIIESRCNKFLLLVFLLVFL